MGLFTSVMLVAADGNGHARLDIQDQLLRAAVDRAVAGAARRLSDPRCEQVLRDFKDVSGRSLDLNLQDLRLSAVEYLAGIWFVDGSQHPICVPGVTAFTAPRSRMLSVCGRAFRRADLVRDTALEMVVIHEMLHSLGLGENGRDPSSAAITRRVTMRCSH